MSPCASSLEEFQRDLSSSRKKEDDFFITMHDPVLPQAGCLLELPRERGNLSAQMGVQARRGSPGVVGYFRCYIDVNTY